MEREVRYCTTEDGVRIAYCVEGEGPPLIALSAFFESFSHEHVMPGRTDALREMTRGHQLSSWIGAGPAFPIETCRMCPQSGSDGTLTP